MKQFGISGECMDHTWEAAQQRANNPVRPWGVQSIGDIYHPNVAAQTPDGAWVQGVAEPYPANLIERIRAAWWVLTGGAVAFIWPKAGDLENAFKERR